MQALLCLKLCSRKNDRNEYRECVREQRPICFSSLNRCIRPGGLADRAAFSYTDLERMAGERMITVAVCDDNIPVLEKLAAMLKELCGHYFSETEIKTYTGGKALLEAHEEAPFDILFLDIRMPEVDGFSVAERIRRMGKKSFVIFVTSQEELVYQVFPYAPYSFIRKRSEALMRKDMEDVLRRLAREFQQERLLRLETAYHVAESVKVREIIYLYSERNYVIYMLTENRRVKVRRALQECEAELGRLGFLRVHRSFLVNMEHIKNISRRDNSICLSNGEMLEIGRTYKDEIEERFLTWLQKGTEHG